ncbi:exosome complex component RRP4 [Nematocida major]|uniref:exosome complex component RRP4 n=1 Tax=Nematocida major TaxID=1912982 RepID=UPI0020086CB9|nr:exosome complex component RRP4 [Nematocida major]KAH9385634.1 exosome complex component RRP4 [Nematocida major]
MLKVWPGQKLEYTDECLEGHGIYKKKTEDGEIFVASVHGQVKQVDRLITVEAEAYWYTPCVGDVVVGKVLEISNKRWYIDVNTRQECILMLSAINLADSVQRRKGELDEIKMSEYYGVGDIVIAEVQTVGNKVQLHTRSPKYRKISFGVLLKADQHQMEGIQQSQQEVVNGKTVCTVVGKNGYIVIHSDDATAHKEIKQVARSIPWIAKNARI